MLYLDSKNNNLNFNQLDVNFESETHKIKQNQFVKFMSKFKSDFVFK